MNEYLSPVGEFSEEIYARLQAYVDLLLKWNQKINLVSRNSANEKEIWRRHVLDCAQLLKYTPQDTGTIIDFGSGAGFPGLVLSILGVRGINLIESNQKKCAFLTEAIRITECDAKVICARIEEIRPFPCDLVIARAFASVNEILNYLSPFLKNETRCLLLKGENVRSEIDEIKSFWQVTEKLYESIVPKQGETNGFVLELKNIKKR